MRISKVETVKPKQRIPCPYCAAQGIKMDAVVKKHPKAILATNTRYGCDNEHYFAVPTNTVAERMDVAA